MRGQDSPHHIFIDVDTECLVDLLCDSRTSEPWVALLYCNDGQDEFL
jgi:hypothetical protein